MSVIIPEIMEQKRQAEAEKEAVAGLVERVTFHRVRTRDSASSGSKRAANPAIAF
jgi:hypothetical protein